MKELLFEIGCEELPASYARGALDAMPGVLARELSDKGLKVDPGTIRVAGTARRLAASIASLPEETPREKKTVTGPPKSAAFKDGKPTKAAEGFAAKNGVPVEKLSTIKTEKGEYLSAEIEEGGRKTSDVLAEALPAVIGAIPFPKSMRWGSLEEKFARPVRWILAAFGGEAVPFHWGGQESGVVTHGHRFLAPGPVEVTTWDAYGKVLEKAHVLVDPARRKAVVREAAQAAAREKGGAIEMDEALLETVSFLVEHPTPVVGGFDPELLELPREVIVTPMKHHQRYFPVVADGALLPFFVTIANVPPRDPSVVARGNERVLRARLADARYFFDLDVQTSLSGMAEGLGRVTFQEKLGSYAEKVERIRTLSAWIRKALESGPAGPGLPSSGDLDRAAAICKADLQSRMVFEFPELQGAMGREYARRAGEPDAVADAIAEHYLPRGAGDSLPESHLGAILSLADRADTLVGIFRIGQKPSGSADPYGLRRHALAILAILRSKEYPLDLRALLEEAARCHEQTAKGHAPDPDEAGAKSKAGASPARWEAAEAMEFVRARFENVLRDEGYPYDAIDAALSARFADACETAARVRAIAKLKERPEIEPVAIGFKRAANILAKAPEADRAGTVDPSAFQHDAERGLHRVALGVAEEVRAQARLGNWSAALGETVKLKDPIDSFYQAVMVMDEDPKVRRNRLALLAEVVGIFSGLADFTRLVQD